MAAAAGRKEPSRAAVDAVNAEMCWNDIPTSGISCEGAPPRRAFDIVREFQERYHCFESLTEDYAYTCIKCKAFEEGRLQDVDLEIRHYVPCRFISGDASDIAEDKLIVDGRAASFMHFRDQFRLVAKVINRKVAIELFWKSEE